MSYEGCVLRNESLVGHTEQPGGQCEGTMSSLGVSVSYEGCVLRNESLVGHTG